MKKQVLSIGAILFLGLSGIAADEVKNGKTPSGRKMTLKFTEELRFGSDNSGDDDFLWGGENPGVTFDSKGNFYVADPGESRVMVYDAEGNFVKQLFRKGEGPGEFYELNSFHILTDGTAIAFDLNQGIGRLQWYDKNQEFVRSTGKMSLRNIYSSLIPSPDGNHFSAVYVSVNQSAGVMMMNMGILDKDLKEAMKLHAAVRPAPNPARFQDPNHWVEFLSHSFKTLFKGYGLSTFDTKGNAYTATSDKYKITKWSPDLKTKLYVMEKDYAPIPLAQEKVNRIIDQQSYQIKAAFPSQLQHLISKNVIAKAVELAEVPAYQNPIYGMITTPDGHLLVIHDFDQGTGKGSADIFDPKGAFIGMVEMDQFAFLGSDMAPRMKFTASKAYTLETTEEEDHDVVRYGYEWVPAK